MTELTAVWMLPIGLGLLGFVEPCTIGGHLVFLRSLWKLTARQKMASLLIFTLTRSAVAGVFGGAAALTGEALASFQAALWIVFGVVYTTLGLCYLSQVPLLLRGQFRLAPQAWRRAQHPIVLGLAFGLNIPACAAPILFGFLAFAASSGAVVSGFGMMFLFGLFLSLPLMGFMFAPRAFTQLESMADWVRTNRWITGTIFVALGIWSIWFGLFVDPVDWTGGQEHS